MTSTKRIWVARAGRNGEAGRQPSIAAYLVLCLKSSACQRVAQFASQLPEVKRADAVRGQFDTILHVEAKDLTALNVVRDKIAGIRGVAGVSTSIVLTEQFDRVAGTKDMIVAPVHPVD